MLASAIRPIMSAFYYDTCLYRIILITAITQIWSVFTIFPVVTSCGSAHTPAISYCSSPRCCADCGRISYHMNISNLSTSGIEQKKRHRLKYVAKVGFASPLITLKKKNWGFWGQIQENRHSHRFYIMIGPLKSPTSKTAGRPLKCGCSNNEDALLKIPKKN